MTNFILARCQGQGRSISVVRVFVVNENSELICRSGVIERIDHGKIFVGVDVASSCAQCHSKEFCHPSETAHKIIEIPLSRESSYKVGDRVLVSLGRATALKSVFWAYVLPLILMIAVLFLGAFLSGDEKIAGLCALGALIPYYALLFFCRNLFRPQFFITRIQ